MTALPPSLYADVTPAGPGAAPLRPGATAEVAVIGGGFTGLSVALHLAEAGRDVALLEAHEPGWGASGRNGGQVNPGLKLDPDAIEARFGPATGAALIELSYGAPQALFDTIARHQIRCDARQQGTLRAARGDVAARAVHESATQCITRGMPVEWLDRAAMRSLTGSSEYAGGLIDRRGGDVNPLALARGLARAAANAGARLHFPARATGLRREGGAWHVQTENGDVLRAEQVVLGTNGYSDGLWPGLSRSVVPVFSSIVATKPLPDALAAAVLPQRCSAYEAGIVTMYYRVDQENRLVLGGRGPQRAIRSPDQVRYLIHHAERLWPGLRGTAEWTHGWNGQLAMTADHLPHVHRPAPGLVAMLGYNGRGVALANALGKALARELSGGDPVPQPDQPIRAIPFQRFWRLGVTAGMLAGRARDAIDRRGQA
ncbi:FAD-binding oxidoreductase [Roseomonas sp. SSH11]|uniref:FAD-binding oxidoreductase n=1 Tax=Pararoseomonas baculiformis TaxID=2820812 RepID=A0ABS4AC19_9PROT|nr:FAD-binding oxidoreductase [Pararoseomonas baculiformis]MBP0444100.1 FAD-binding oxidoreductase [Pararoseomonas baculiformis]